VNNFEILINTISKHKNSGVLIDTNLLLLYFVGKFNKDTIKFFKRTKNYNEEDFIFLSKLITLSGKIVTTPQILTEVSNLAGELKDNIKNKFFDLFSREIQLLDEEYKESKAIAICNEFNKYGITDALIILLAKENIYVITNDFPLSNYLQSKNIDVLNINNIRPYYWK